MPAPAVGLYTQLAAGKGGSLQTLPGEIPTAGPPFIVGCEHDDLGLLVLICGRDVGFQVTIPTERLTSRVPQNKQKHYAVPEMIR